MPPVLTNPPNARTTLRIVSLLPSATDIVAALGLSSNLVGVTHECDVPPGCSDGTPLVLTGSRIDIVKDGQAEIDAKVKDAAERAGANKNAACALPSGAAAAAIRASSLYPINEDNLKVADPTVVLTQDLCGVCAPSTGEVRRALDTAAGNKGSKAQNVNGVEVLSLEPETLSDVADTFVVVADACGVRERGEEMKHSFLSNLSLLQSTVSNATSVNKEDGRSEGGNGSQQSKESKAAKPRVLLLEWLDPPYDGGHWIPGMIEHAGCEMAAIGSDSSPSPSSWNGTKSKQITWDDVYKSDPDVVLVACCGFGLDRNVADALVASDKLCKLRAAREGRMYAADGNLYFARPGPTLLGGANIVAQCAFDGADGDVKAAVQALEFAPKEGVGWTKIDLSQTSIDGLSSKEMTSVCVKPITRPSDVIHDIEDVVIGKDYSSVHKAACDAGSMDYIDPDTGYYVFTELAHKKRGKCCGSGCRHCPFNHENVRPDLKASKIMQPSFLYEGEESGLFSMSSDSQASYKRIKVLFFSGGKDSFLTIRAIVRQRLADGDSPFGLVLLTTFDATSRIIAHQEAPINTVIRQATHLQVPLVGVPVHRGSSETYVDRIRRAMDLVSTKFGKDKPLTLVFGDLHLDHIRHWRDDSLGKLKCDLEYPLWQVPYPSLMNDLETSLVVCEVSASNRDGVQEGEVFNRELSDRVMGSGMDGFGEEGEFHTVAKVWGVGREQALGL